MKKGIVRHLFAVYNSIFCIFFLIPSSLQSSQITAAAAAANV